MSAILKTLTVSFDEIVCKSCGITFYVPEDWRSNKVANNGTFYCPNGCCRHYVGETDAQRAERLGRELNAAIEAKRFAERRLTDEQERHRKDIARRNRRASAGVCPCCNRTVSQMARHMKSKHPEFQAK